MYPTCEWHEDPDGVWSTGCGTAFEFLTGGPEENGFKFCPYCGAEIRAFKVEEEESER